MNLGLLAELTEARNGDKLALEDRPIRLRYDALLDTVIELSHFCYRRTVQRARGNRNHTRMIVLAEL